MSYQETVLRQVPAGVPTAADFETIERPALRAPAAGEIAVRVIALSLDPYIGPRLRGRHMGEAAPAPGAARPPHKQPAAPSNAVLRAGSPGCGRPARSAAGHNDRE